MGYGPDLETVDADEVAWIDGVEREIVRNSDGSDQRVERASSWLASCCAQAGCDSTERACSGGIERDRVEVGLGLLHVRLPSGALLIAARHERSDGELCEGDRGDRRPAPAGELDR
jgi:hypothetical protein